LQSGLLTFGGAYTILPFLDHDAVDRFQWLTKNQFLDGIALASILPAPLVIIATFVGYVGGGLLGAVLITIGVFLPAFGFTLLGHSVVERITQWAALHQFLDGVAAGVVGLIVVTTLSISLHVIHTPFQLAILIAALFVTYRSRFTFTVPLLVLGAGVLGIIVQQP
jgi:chromate transporter